MLPITVPYNLGETPPSLASRLAQASGREHVRDFALDVGLDFDGVVAGRADALDRLSGLCGCDLRDLTSWAATEIDDRTILRGQDLGRRNLRRSRVFACPDCLREDLANETLEPEVRAWGRAVWQIPALRTCMIHGRELVEIARADEVKALHDLAALALEGLADMDELDRRSRRRPASAFEHYVHRRLEGAAAVPDSLLDTLPLYAAIHLCENLGAVTVFGPTVRKEDLGESDMHMAGQNGFEHAVVGEAGIRSALCDLQDRFREGTSDWGLRSMFGRFYDWLAHENDDDVYEPVRDIVRRHVVETMPVGPGEMLFGREVEGREIHSLHSASLEYGLHPKRLRKLLRSDGLIKDDDHSLSDERVLFRAGAASTRLSALSECMSLKKAGEYLGAPRPHERLLFEAGFIIPIVNGGTGTLKDHAFRRSELDDFLKRLTCSIDQNFFDGSNIPRAAKRANCSAMEIVRLLLDGELRKVGRDDRARGYLSVCVDPEEVKALVRGAEHGGLSLREVEKRMRWSTAVVRALVDGGHLASTVAINPINRCAQRVVFEHDLLAFDRTFISLTSLAVERATHFRRLKSDLTAAGVAAEPAFEGVPATFYSRVQVNTLLPA